MSDAIVPLIADASMPPASSAPEPLVYDTADLCHVLRLSVATLHRLKAAGKLPRARKLGGQLRWNVSEIREWVGAGMPDLNRWEALQNANGRR
jgi:predicted DNA-binding transcriptional regulator AlpA